MNSKNNKVLRVPRTKAQAKERYDKISGMYDYLEGVFVRKYRNIALQRLNIGEGEIALEVGFGTGHCLKQMAESVGEHGKVYGIDISSGMMAISRKRIEKAGLLDRVELHCGDAVEMPYEDNKFDAVFMSFTLELFDTPEIPEVLHEIKRVLKPKGRIGVIGMSKENKTTILLRLYEWAHKKFPQYVDCRPIYLAQTLKDNGFRIEDTKKVEFLGIPMEIAVALKLS